MMQHYMGKVETSSPLWFVFSLGDITKPGPWNLLFQEHELRVVFIAVLEAFSRCKNGRNLPIHEWPFGLGNQGINQLGHFGSSSTERQIDICEAYNETVSCRR